MVFYRKYRPQTIEDLDSTSVRENLSKILSSSSIPHAFLLTGPRGLGKTSAARIIAKSINCDSKSKKNDFEPCNKCDACKSITEGINTDIIEIDAASNRGIDEIRELRDRIRLLPVSVKTKVYIIDEVHMLTTEAFNALLKTLEEPPSHVVFILATTEQHKVPDTIKSRCTHIIFRRASRDELIRSFKRVLKGEKITASDQVLSDVADLSEGGFRDGVKIIEELSLLTDNKNITKDLLNNKFLSSSFEKELNEFMSCLIEKDSKKCIQISQNLTKENFEIKLFIKAIIDNLHKILLSNHLGNNYSIDVKESYHKNLSDSDLSSLYEIFSKAYKDCKSSPIEVLPLQLAILEWCNKNFNLDETQTEDNNEIKNKKLPDIEKLRNENGRIFKEKALNFTENNTKDKKVKSTPSKFNLLTFDASGKHSNEWFEEFWSEFISQVKLKNHTISGVLRGCSLGLLSKDSMTIKTSYKFHKEKLSDPKVATILENCAQILTGKKISVSVELVE